MNFLHSRLQLRANALVEVSLSRPGANVMIMSDFNYDRYSRGQPFEYYGDNFNTTQVRLVAPTTGFWNLVVDLGGAPGTISATYSVTQVPPGTSARR